MSITIYGYLNDNLSVTVNRVKRIYLARELNFFFKTVTIYFSNYFKIIFLKLNYPILKGKKIETI